MSSHSAQSAMAELAAMILRQVPDAGAIIGGKLRAARDGRLFNLDGARDLWTAVRETVSNHQQPPVSWLHPAGILFGWADAREGDDVVVLRARRTPQEGSVAIHGFHRNESWLPPWLLEKVGLYARAVLRIESTENDIELEPGAGKKIKLGDAATRGVARVSDGVAVPFSVSVASIPSVPPTSSVSIAWTNEHGVSQTLVFTAVGAATLNGSAVATSTGPMRGSIADGSSTVIAGD